jgi:hypothetical protein
MSFFSNTADRLANLFGYVRAKPEETVRWENREKLFAVNELLYSGGIYRTRANGGALEDVLKTYVGHAYCDPNLFPIQPAFMPFRPIVDAYQNVLPGNWGETIKPAGTFDGKPINPKLIPALSAVWRMSNLDTAKMMLFRWAANFGTVGIRITAREQLNDVPARVSLNIDHPARLFNFEEDSEGNVVAVCLKYKIAVNHGTLAEPDWATVEVVEEITKDGFSVRHDEIEQLNDGQRANRLGFCPYVILRHKENETPFGDWAYKGSEAAVHRINWRISRQDKSIDRHQFPRWFAAAGGKAPTTDINMGDDQLVYVQIAPDTPPPILKAIVPTIDQSEARAFWQDLRDMLRMTQPEMNLNDVKLIAGISGETLAQALKPTEEAITSVKPGYQHALIRALQMAVSAGIVVGAWDIGTGTGSLANSDQAFRTGLENFEFAPTPSLPLSTAEKLQQPLIEQASTNAKLDTANKAAKLPVSEAEQLRLAGYDQKGIDKIQLERKTQDVIPAEAM